MELTKFGHACVRLDSGDRRLVIDPGTLTDPRALEGATAVLVTHEHPDHFAEDALRRAADADPELRIWTNGAVAGVLDGLGGRVRTVGAGDSFTAAGFDVKVYGEWHALVHEDIPRVGNIGFLVDDSLFHPGDAMTVPDQPVETLLLPVHGPWSRTGELVDWVREVAPRQAYAIHDGALNDAGLALVGRLLGTFGRAPYTRLAPGESVGL